MTFAVLLTFSLLLSTTSATVIQRDAAISLTIQSKRNPNHQFRNIAQNDRIRVQALLQHADGRPGGVMLPVTNALEIYTANITVGSGKYSVFVDTGSSNTWVGADPNNLYKPGPYSQATGESVKVNYGSGNFMGFEFIDDLVLGPAKFTQSIGAANASNGFGGADGILGIGPVDLTNHTLRPNNSLIPTVTDNLKSQGLIRKALVGVAFLPTSCDKKQPPGELTFGDIDETKFIGEINYHSTTKTFPSKFFWGVDQSITYGKYQMPILSTAAGIVDTGTTLMLLATDAFQAYQQATGGTFDNKTGLLIIPDVGMLESLYFHIDYNTYELTPNAQVWPRCMNNVIGGDPDNTYGIVGDIGTPSGQGLDFINGFTFLQRFYSVYDTERNAVGLAITPHTFDNSN